MTADTANPLLSPWPAPFGMPPFAMIAPEHFPAAFEQGLAEHKAEIEVIAAQPEPATFGNTIEALERGGRTLQRVSATFFNLAHADTSDALRKIERDIAPVLARHNSAIHLDSRLFGRIDDLWRRRGELALSDEQARVLERYHTRFLRSGAGLPADAKARYGAIGERLATLGTRFAQNVLADETTNILVLETQADLEGLPDFFKAAAARAAADRGLAGKWVVSMARSSIEPFLQFSKRRDLREKAFRLWAARGAGGGETDNRAIVAETLALRAERAKLLGFATFAHYRLDDAMAKTPEAAHAFLWSVWQPARVQAQKEREALQALATAEGANADIAPWDWRYYAERRRQAEFDLDETEIKPYLQLDNIIEAAFDTAQRLFGLSFVERSDLPTYHADVRAFEVRGRDGRHIGIFLGDYFARPSKRSGAWMSGFREQRKLDGETRPIIVNVMNFAKADDGPTLLSFDDARTLFHEFGHGLHGLLSDVTYPMISGTSVARDFVEFPSQVYEHWLEQPEVLRRFAKHYRTGEEMPEALLQRLLAARRFNQGFATVEFLASALVDLDYHMAADVSSIDVAAFERASLERIGLPEGIAMRHATPHFTHVFAGESYAAGYYSYMWSEILDADGFAAFEEAGDIFAPAVAKRLHDHVYSAGGASEPAEAYRRFRGRMPSPEAVLKQRGLSAAP
jgi:peptidyl-dipeptidase Dcp